MHIKNILLLFLLSTVLFSGGMTYAKPPVFLDNYNESVQVSKQLNQPLILIFSADWCVYCKKLKKDISDNLDRFEDTTICIVDINENPELAKKYKVRSIPRTLVFNKEKRLTQDYKGYIDFHLLRAEND